MLIIDNPECTACLDAYIEEGWVCVPNDLKELYGDTLKQTDILLRGNFPHDLIDHTAFFINIRNLKLLESLLDVTLIIWISLKHQYSM